MCGKNWRETINRTGYLTLEKHCVVQSDELQFIPRGSSTNEYKMTFKVTSMDTERALLLNEILNNNKTERHFTSASKVNYTALLNEITNIQFEIEKNSNMSDIKVEPLYSSDDEEFNYVDYIILIYWAFTFILGLLVAVYLIFSALGKISETNLDRVCTFWRNPEVVDDV